MQSIEDKILARIYGHGRGWVFSKVDFLDLAPGATVDSALSRLRRRGSIRRISSGLYDYPRSSTLLDEELTPDMPLVAQAIARRYNWHIVADGSTALHSLGLSEQVPARFAYLSSGPSRTMQVMGATLGFRHRKTQHTAIADSDGAILVQAIQAIGKESIRAAEISRLSGLFSPQKFRRIVQATRTASTWIHDVIKASAALSQIETVVAESLLSSSPTTIAGARRAPIDHA